MTETAVQLERHVGRMLRERSRELTQSWLERLLDRLDEAPRRIFPTDKLLDHIPDVLTNVAAYVEMGGGAGTEQRTRESLYELAKLRREQGYKVQEILEELEILGNLLFEAVEEEVARYEGEASAKDAVAITRRLYQALLSMTTYTADAFREASLRDRRERAQLLGSFGQALAHELRNRLHAAEIGLQMLDEVSEGRAKELVDRVMHTFRGIGSVAQDVSALAIAQSSEEAARGRRRSLPEIVPAVVRELQPLADRHRVQVEILGEVPDVQADATRLELVLVNLIGNAIKYADRRKDRRWVRIRAEHLPQEKGYQMSVADNGIGISDDMQAQVFENFVRGPSRGADGIDTDGTGLGLGICREAVEQLGGHLWVESRHGEGSTFSFTFPEPEEGGEEVD